MLAINSENVRKKYIYISLKSSAFSLEDTVFQTLVLLHSKMIYHNLLFILFTSILLYIQNLILSISKQKNKKIQCKKYKNLTYFLKKYRHLSQLNATLNVNLQSSFRSTEIVLIC